MNHISAKEFYAMQAIAAEHFTVHDFLEWLQSIADERAALDPQLQADLDEIEALLIARKVRQ